MRNRCFQNARKIWYAFAFFAAVGVFWFGYARVAAARRVRLESDRTETISLPPAFEYTFHDGATTDGNAPSPEQPKPDAPAAVDALDLRKAYERAGQLFAQTKGKVFKATITPHWFDNNTRFWYRNDLKDGAKEFVLVDAEKGTRLPAFDHPKLAAGLSKAHSVVYKACCSGTGLRDEGKSHTTTRRGL